MTTVNTYPWALDAFGLHDELADLAAIGVDRISVAAHYHSIQTITPRAPDTKTFQYPGGCYFDPPREPFTETSLKPKQNDVPGFDDPLDAITAAANSHDIDVNAWVVCNHNSRLATRYPDYQIESAFGGKHEHALCPSWPVVQQYFAEIIDAITAYDIAQIDLETIGYPISPHTHGASFGHTKDWGLTAPVDRVLYSQCFCEGCRRCASRHPVDLDAAQARVQSLLEDSIQEPTSPLPTLETLTATYPELDRLFDFRRAVIDSLLDTLQARSPETPLNYFVADGTGRNATDGHAMGVDLSATEQLDVVTALCYTADPQTARDRIETIHSQFAGPTNAAISLNPEIIPDLETLEALTQAVHDSLDNDLYVYNYSLMGDTQVDHLATVLS